MAFSLSVLHVLALTVKYGEQVIAGTVLFHASDKHVDIMHKIAP